MQVSHASIVSTDTQPATGPAPGIDFAPGLMTPGIVMSFARNEEIFGEEEDADFVYRVISGAARTVRLLSDGRRQIVGFHLAGEVFGWESGGRHRCSAEAVADCQIALVKRSVLDKVAAADGAVARLLWGLAVRDLDRSQDHMLRLGRKTAVERLAAFLLEMDSRDSTTNGVDLLMSRSDIADYLGLTIETVSRTFTQLMRDGVIAMPSARHIVLRNRRALADLDA